MDALGIPTTRALSLIRSEGGDVSNRPWYSASVEKQVSKQLNEVTVDDPRLARFDASEREAIVGRVRAQKRDPDTMIQEPNAITTRVAPSFLRVGHAALTPDETSHWAFTKMVHVWEFIGHWLLSIDDLIYGVCSRAGVSDTLKRYGIAGVVQW